MFLFSVYNFEMPRVPLYIKLNINKFHGWSMLKSWNVLQEPNTKHLSLPKKEIQDFTRQIILEVVPP